MSKDLKISLGHTWKLKLAAGISPGAEAMAFAEFALAQVSRTFALNIKVLPRPLRDQVLYAYLYCRMADTIEDDALIPASEKGRLLRLFAQMFAEENLELARGSLENFSSQLPTTWQESQLWEHLLLVHAPVCLRPYFDFPEPVRKVLSRCIGEMCQGMAGFAEKAETAPSQDRGIIQSLEELDNYCYYVAGTVGVLLCDLFIRHSGKIRAHRAQSLKSLCISFGLGLQLTNILKDLHDDKERNISWLPNDLLASESLSFQEFLKSEKAVGGRKRIYRTLFSKAKRHLEDALEYSCLIPRWDRRLRLFCLWPLFMAAETLALLAESTEALTQGKRLKISRKQVETIVRRTSLFSWSNRWVRAEFRKPISRLESAIKVLAAS